MVTTNTFGATRYKLPAGLDVFAVNELMARTAHRAVGGGVFVAGSVGPTGKMVHPLGDISFRSLVLNCGGPRQVGVRGHAQGGWAWA